MDQKQVVEALKKTDAFDEKTGEIEVIQTHISFIFLTRNFVYKVKKAVDFGFLDFTTLEKRHFFCKKELELNRRLCGDMYIEVVPITRSDIIRLCGEGEIIEYAVKMKRIPEEKIMSRLLEEGKVDKRIVEEIAEILADFHLKAKTSKEINKFGSISVIKRNWRENFLQTEDFIGRTLSFERHQFIREKVDEFIRKKRALFAKRIANDRIRDCHGDVHSGNIFLADKIYIFDAIEFNERFRYSDVAAEIAFLAMDLDFKGWRELSSFFVDRYVAFSGDRELKGLLSFYKCYRAYVRGKVTSFKLNDSRINTDEKNLAKKDASAYFDLAAHYAKWF